MKRYTVRQLARLSGVSVRALHHYDAIGLLKPAFVGGNRYRYYGRDELLRLQDILCHRELGVPLHEIARLPAKDGTERLALLAAHRLRLVERVQRARQLLATIDRTIAELNGDGTMDDHELYKGFSPEKQAKHERYLVDRYGGMQAHIDRSKAARAAQSDEQRAAALAEGEAAAMALRDAFLAGTAADDAALDPALDRHRGWVSRMWDRPCPPAAYAGLGDLYRSHPDFRAGFEKSAEGLTDWLAEAMQAYAARHA